MFEGLPWRLWVKKQRKALGLTQADVAQLVHYSVEMIGHIERGVDRPAPDLAQRLAVVLEVSPADQAEFVEAARRGKREPAHPMARSQEPLPLRIPDLADPLFIGREADFTQVQALLDNPEVRLVTIAGLAGVGKTRLAQEVAQARATRYPTGIIWVRLTGLRDPDLVLDTVAQALEILPTRAPAVLDRLQSALCDKPVLLILDNCEQVPGIGALLADLLAVPGPTILATSRRRLRVRGEHLVTLDPLATPPSSDPITPERVQTYPAVTLFLARVRETVPGFRLDMTNVTPVAQICAALDGLPLALELAASWIHLLPPAALRSRLADRLDWSRAGHPAGAASAQSLRHALRTTYALLGPRTQCWFRCLGAFAGSFTLAAVGAICELPDSPGPDLLPLLHELHEWHLVQPMGGSPEDPRYGMLETVRDYAARCLRDSGEERPIRQRHLQFYLALAEQTRTVSSPARPTSLLHLDAEAANLRAALDWALSPQGDRAAGWQLGVALGEYWETRGMWHEGRTWFQRLLDPAPDATHPLAAALHYNAGRFAYLQADYTTANRLLATSLALSRQQGDRALEIQALNTLGWIAYSQADLRPAQRFYAESLAVCRALGDTRAIATALNVLGGVTVAFGDLDAGEQMMHESLQLRQTLGEPAAVAPALAALGLAAQHRDDHRHARLYITDSLDLARAAGDKISAALALSSLGWTDLAQGDLVHARSRLADAVTRAQELGSGWVLSLASTYLGWVACAEGQFAEAGALFHDALGIARMQQIHLVLILARLGQAEIALQVGDPRQAASYWQAAEELRATIGLRLIPFEQRIVARLQQALAAYL